MKLNTIIQNRKKLLNIPEPKLEPVTMKHPLLWEPKVGDEYWSNEYGEVTWSEYYGDTGDKVRLEFGNCWQTQELAEIYGMLGAVTPYLREIARYNSNPDGSYWWPDWETGQCKYHWGWDGQFVFETSYCTQLKPDFFYTKDIEFNPSPTALASFKKYLGVI